MRLWLSGASSVTGRALLEKLAVEAISVYALSRSARRNGDRVQWTQADLASAPAPPLECSAWVNLGPLDAFVGWLQRQRATPALRQIISLGSTSVHTKSDSSSSSERALAQRLSMAEAGLRACGERLCVPTTLLRPTLIYGGSHDLVARIGAVASRWHVYPWLVGAAAQARRQPVHAADLADAVLAALRLPGDSFRAYDLPGGEILSLRALIRRAAAARTPYALPVPVPAALLLRLSGGHAQAALDRHSVARMARDQLFDDRPAREALGYAPRAFRP